MLWNPIDKMSQEEIAEELRTAYALTDLSGCKKRSDYAAKLKHYRQTELPTYGHTYSTRTTYGHPPIATGLVVMADGMSSNPKYWETLSRDFSTFMTYLLFVKPTPPPRPLTAKRGAPYPAWYDFYPFGDDLVTNTSHDAAGVMQSAAYLAALAAQVAARHGIDPRRVAFAGFADGAAAALAAALTAPVAPAGVAMLSGYLAGASLLAGAVRNTQMPVAMYHGRKDYRVPIALARESKRVLEEELRVSPPVELHEYDAEHEQAFLMEAEFEAFLRRVLPKMYK